MGKSILIMAVAWLSCLCAMAENDDEFASEMIFVELNCENLFDCEHDSLKQDEAFLPDGLYRWTPTRYWTKLNNIAREILSCGEQEDGTFVIPDLVALCEVENDTVMRDLTKRSLLRNAQYEYIMTASPDVRGIDVALLYSPLTFAPIIYHSIRIQPLKGMRPTRDILYVKGRTASTDTLNIFIVHAPSRMGGEIETRPHRQLVNNRLREAVDSVFTACGNDAKIIVAGDFNDYKVAHHPNMIDISEQATGRNGAKGTYKFHGEWGSLDHIFITPAMNGHVKLCRIGDAEFLLTKDEDYGGKQPNRTFRGIKWSNAFADHLPLILNFRF